VFFQMAFIVLLSKMRMLAARRQGLWYLKAPCGTERDSILPHCALP
jgi:hypothetical protein